MVGPVYALSLAAPRNMERTPMAPSSDDPGPGDPPPADPSIPTEADFVELYEFHGRELYAYLLHQVGDAEAAGECFRNTLLKGWKNRRQTSADRLRPWLYVIARHLADDYFRRLAAAQRAGFDI